MAGGTDFDGDEITGINVTPLVDVMLVLLVIFMVTASYIVNRSINVKLPTADTAEDQISTKNLAFVLDKDSALYLDGQKLTWAEAPQAIAEEKQKIAAKENHSLQALISADIATPHGAVVKLIDMVRKSGITEFAINVEVQALQNDEPPLEKGKAIEGG